MMILTLQRVHRFSIPLDKNCTKRKWRYWSNKYSAPRVWSSNVPGAHTLGESITGSPPPKFIPYNTFSISQYVLMPNHEQYSEFMTFLKYVSMFCTCFGNRNKCVEMHHSHINTKFQKGRLILSD